MQNDGWQIRGTIRSKKQAESLQADFDIVQIKSIGAGTDWSGVLVGVDVVVHLAAMVHVVNDTEVDQLSKFRMVNVAGADRLAQEAALANVKRFIYISSAKVNGEGRSKPYNEDDVQQPHDPYSMSKAEAENTLHKIDEETGMEIVILRSPLVYGPRVKANFLRLLKVVDQGIPLPFASIKNKRSLIYIGNLVNAILTCINNPKAAGNTYFVSDGEDISTPDLIRRISSALGKPDRLFAFPPVMLKMAGFIAGQSAAIDRLLRSLMVDSSKIRRELDWQAPFSMDQGLEETAKWYLKRRNISRKGAKTLR